MLHRKKNTTNITKLMVDVDEKQIPMIIYRERRRSWRVAVGQHSVNLRIPTTWHYGMPENPVEWAVEWTQAKYRKQPELFDHFFLSPPHDGQLYQTLFGAFVLSVLPVSRKTAAAKISGNILQIRYPEIWGKREQSDIFPRLVSKVFAKDFHDRFSERVAILNERFYRFHYSDISFKYNKSNWGSCSHTGHLNFSTRLFLAPQIVVDYVIIHELAHLREHNHSPAFWKVVEYAMPRYKDQVSWLKKHGSKLYF